MHLHHPSPLQPIGPNLSSHAGYADYAIHAFPCCLVRSYADYAGYFPHSLLHRLIYSHADYASYADYLSCSLLYHSVYSHADYASCADYLLHSLSHHLVYSYADHASYADHCYMHKKCLLLPHVDKLTTARKQCLSSSFPQHVQFQLHRVTFCFTFCLVSLEGCCYTLKATALLSIICRLTDQSPIEKKYFMSFFDQHALRIQYLERLFARYGTVRLPIDPVDQSFPLHTVFQPMLLRRDPLTPQDDSAEIVQALDSAEALTKSLQRRVVVLGGPGMGKTTALKALLHQAIELAQTDLSAPFPLFVSLPDLARTSLSLHEYTHNIVAELELDPRFTDVLIAAIEEGHAFLCLDSLDEVLPALRPAVIVLINREALRCQGTWIVGSRFTEYKGGQFSHSQFAEWELQPLDEPLRLALANQLLPALYATLHAHTPQALRPAFPSAKAYVDALQRDAHMTTWGHSPLLFSLAAVLYVQTGTLPSSRALLYQQVTETMFTLRIPTAAQHAQARDLLATLALEFYQTHGRNFTIQHMLTLLSALNPTHSAQTLYATLTLLLDTGVLEPVAYQTYGFKHQMFQEYLAAFALARQLCAGDALLQEHTWQLLWRKRRFSRWHEILSLLVGVLVQDYAAPGLQLAHNWLSALLAEAEIPAGDPGDLCLLLAMHSLREFGAHLLEPAVAALGRRILERWAERLIALDQQTDWLSIQHLRKQSDQLFGFSLQTLLPVLTLLQEQGNLYRRIFYSLWTAPGLVSFMLPVSMLQHLFHDIPITLYACHTLRALQTPTSIERLQTLLNNTQQDWTIEEQVLAVHLLENLGAQMPVALLTALYQDTTRNADLRAAAVQALSQADVPAPLALFIPMLNDSAGTIRSIAIKVIATHAGQSYTHLLIAALHDTQPNVRLQALQCLRQLEASIPATFQHTLLLDENNAACLEAAWQYFAAHVPLTILLAALQHEDRRVYKNALVFIEQYADQLPVEPFLKLFTVQKNDHITYRDTREQTIEALGLLGKRVPLQSIRALLQHNNRWVRSGALTILYRRGASLPPAILLPMLRDKEVGEIAALTISTLGAAAPIVTLLEMLTSRSFDAKYFVAMTLRLLHAYVPTHSVLPLLQNKEFLNFDAPVYWELIQLLQLKGVEIPLDWLTPVLKIDLIRNPNLNLNPAIELLCHAGSQAPIATLLHLIYQKYSENHQPPNWIKPIGYALYEWVSPTILINTLCNTPRDHRPALSLLALAADQDSIALLTAVAQDTTYDHITRTLAASSLNNLKVNLPLDCLVQVATWSSFEDVMRFLGDTVARLGAQTPVEQLLPLLGEDNSGLQIVVALALMSIAQHIPVETILPLLEDKNIAVRKAAICILGAMGERAPIDLLLQLLRDPQQDLTLRWIILSSLGKPDLRAPIPVSVLLEMLLDANDGIKMATLIALKAHGTNVPIAPLLTLLDDPGNDVRKYTIETIGELGRQGVPVPVEVLSAFLDDEDAFIVREAADALCKLGERTPVTVLLAHLSDKSSNLVNEFIFSALAKLGIHAPLEAMLAALATINATLSIEDALQTMAETLPERLLKQLHADTRPAFRIAVLQAIRVIGTGEWLPLVLTTLEVPAHIQWRVFYTAVQALGALHACAPVDPLLQILQTGDNNDRIAVLEVLGNFGTRVPLAALLPLLGSNNNHICTLTCKVLQQIYPSTFQELLPQARAILRGEPLPAAFASRMHYRIAETVALMGRATPAVLDMLVALLDWPFWEVRARATTTLGTLRRNIPDSAIRKLMTLCKDPTSPVVQLAANESLAAILSLEQGMEDE